MNVPRRTFYCVQLTRSPVKEKRQSYGRTRQELRIPDLSRNHRRGKAPSTLVVGALASKLAITPEGVLARIEGGHYTHLYFGNPGSANVQINFSIDISPADATLFEDLQNALAGNHLFMVFPSLGTIRESA